MNQVFSSEESQPARQGDCTTHGGCITMGFVTVQIGICSQCACMEKQPKVARASWKYDDSWTRFVFKSLGSNGQPQIHAVLDAAVTSRLLTTSKTILTLVYPCIKAKQPLSSNSSRLTCFYISSRVLLLMSYSDSGAKVRVFLLPRRSARKTFALTTASLYSRHYREIS